MGTPDFWKHVAIIAVLIIIFVILLKPRKKDHNSACIKDYEALKLQIVSCKNIEECNQVEKDLEAYWDYYYKRANTELLKTHYNTLICELTYIKDFIRYGQGSTKQFSQQGFR
jgi:hypothetical protein